MRLVLERRERARGTPPRPRVRDLVVRPHELSGYDALVLEPDDAQTAEDTDLTEDGNDSTER